MGGFYEDADACNNGCNILLTFKPKYVNTYEVGYKGTLLDQRLRLSVTYFLSDYTDMQDTGDKVIGVDTRDTPNQGEPVTAWTTDNLSKPQIQGLELEFEFEYMPWDNGRSAGYAAWLDTEIKEASFEDGYARAERKYYNQSRVLCGAPNYDTTVGNKLSFAPNFSLSVNYEHDIHLDSGFTLQPFVSLHWQDDMWLNNQNYDDLHLSQKQDAYYKIGASIRLMSPDETYYVELAGMNLTDEDTRNYGGTAAGVVTGSYDDPLLYSLRFGYNFQ